MTLRLPKRLLRASHGAVRNLLGGPDPRAGIHRRSGRVCWSQFWLDRSTCPRSCIAGTEPACALPILVLYVAMFTAPVLVLSIAPTRCEFRPHPPLGSAANGDNKLALTAVFGLRSVALAAFTSGLWW